MKYVKSFSPCRALGTCKGRLHVRLAAGILCVQPNLSNQGSSPSSAPAPSLTAKQGT